MKTMTSTKVMWCDDEKLQRESLTHLTQEEKSSQIEVKTLQEEPISCNPEVCLPGLLSWNRFNS